jgi:hypothetical protein
MEKAQEAEQAEEAEEAEETEEPLLHREEPLLQAEEAEEPLLHREEPLLRSREEQAIENWTRILRRAQRVRSLQRIFGQIGPFLQTFGQATRKQLKVVYPRE